MPDRIGVVTDTSGGPTEADELIDTRHSSCACAVVRPTHSTLSAWPSWPTAPSCSPICRDDQRRPADLDRTLRRPAHGPAA
jgi:hypothetical protein